MYFYTTKDDHNNIVWSASPITDTASLIPLTANTSDGAVEKHIPVVKRNGNQVAVVIGSVLHPMIDVHFIKAIVMETDKGLTIKELMPYDEPRASFILDTDEKLIAVYAYCNIHGLWKVEL